MTRLVVAVTAAALAVGACGGSLRLDEAGARDFSRAALRATGLAQVDVAEGVEPCEVGGVDGLRTRAATEVGEVSLCVSREAGRALSVRDPGLSDEQFRRLERYRGTTSEDRARPLAAASAGLLLAGNLIQLLLRLRPARGRPS